jgi:3-phosphoshikimate 1-carboxyvinyltransferase
MGVINVPASKSDAQRAILVAALVPDTSRVYNYGSSDDVKAMISCIQELGAICSLSEDFIEIRGLNIFPDKVCFNCGESGLSFRLLAALSMVLKGDFELHGRDSLLSRDHSFIEAFGLGRSVQVQSNNGQIPYIIKGRIEEEIYTIDAGITSQFLSGLLIALAPSREANKNLCR